MRLENRRFNPISLLFPVTFFGAVGFAWWAAVIERRQGQDQAERLTELESWRKVHEQEHRQEMKTLEGKMRREFRQERETLRKELEMKGKNRWVWNSGS